MNEKIITFSNVVLSGNLSTMLLCHTTHRKKMEVHCPVTMSGSELNALIDHLALDSADGSSWSIEGVFGSRESGITSNIIACVTSKGNVLRENYIVDMYMKEIETIQMDVIVFRMH